jgi:hypothetical protein
MRLKLLRDEIGCCICEDCRNYSTISKICTEDRRQPDSADSCTDFYRSYGVYGDNMNTTYSDYDY